MSKYYSLEDENPKSPKVVVSKGGKQEYTVLQDDAVVNFRVNGKLIRVFLRQGIDDDHLEIHGDGEVCIKLKRDNAFIVQ